MSTTTTITIHETAYWRRTLTADERAVLMFEGIQNTFHPDRSYWRDAYLRAAPRLRALEYQQKIAQLGALQERQCAWIVRYGWHV